MKLKKKQNAATSPTALHYDTVLSPVITEKSTMANEHNKYVFNVALDADKATIKSSVEAIFGVKVAKVNTLRRLGKTKRFRQILGKQVDTKKAIVTLKEGETIDFEGGTR